MGRTRNESEFYLQNPLTTPNSHRFGLNSSQTRTQEIVLLIYFLIGTTRSEELSCVVAVDRVRGVTRVEQTTKGEDDAVLDFIDTSTHTTRTSPDSHDDQFVHRTNE